MKSGARPSARETARPGTVDEAQVRDLEQVMRDLLLVHERMHAMGRDRSEALRSADPSRLGACIARENELVQRIAEIEKRRLGVVTGVAERLGSPDRSQTRFTWIAERLPEPWRSRLMTLAQSLRGAIEQVRKENDRFRIAAGALSSHIDGLMQQAAARLNHAQVYGRRGAIDPGAAVVSIVDLRS